MLLKHQAPPGAPYQTSHVSEGRSYVETRQDRDRTRYLCNLCSTHGGSGIVPLNHTVQVFKEVALDG